MLELKKIIDNNEKTALLITAAGLTLFAWFNRFIQDDAFISFRYARNFAAGHGLVWNVGEKVEGYTNFLWVIIMAIPFKLGVDPILFSQTIGLILFFITLMTGYNLAKLIFKNNIASLLTVMLLGINYTFSSFATGGLETQLHVCLFLLAALLVFKAWESSSPSFLLFCSISILFAFLVMTRMDSIILFLPLLIMVIIKLTRSSASNKYYERLLFLLPFIIIVGGWLYWKISYYGDIFPNSFYVKVSDKNSLIRGLIYLNVFLSSYWLTPFLLLIPWVVNKMKEIKMAVLTLISICWGIYLVKIGGDFMEFRMLAPIMPIIFILMVWSLSQVVKRNEIRIVFVIMVIIGNITHIYDGWDYRIGIESLKTLQGHITSKDENWKGIGQKLGEMFGQGKGISIATTAAGAIPFYSNLTTIDMLGLNDKWVARHGNFISVRPGHQIIAPVNYLLNRRVNLVLGRVWQENKGEELKREFGFLDVKHHFFIDEEEYHKCVKKNRIIKIPINKDQQLIVLYLTPNEWIDRLIRENGWESYKLADYL